MPASIHADGLAGDEVGLTDDLSSGCFDDGDAREVSPLRLKPSHLFDIKTAEPDRSGGGGRWK